MNDPHGKTRGSHRKMKFRTRSLGVLGAVLLIAISGVVTWSILEGMSLPERSDTSDNPRNREAAVELVELTGWGVAMAVPEGVAKEDVIVTTIQPAEAAVVPDSYGLSTKAFRDNVKHCGVENDDTMILTRTTHSPTLSSDEFLAGTSKIGDYYYVYRFTTGAISEANCTGEVRAILSRETQLLERMVSNIQLN